MEDDEYIEYLLKQNGFAQSGDYHPAFREDGGRYSVDPTTLALLLTVYQSVQATR